jgi:hypothetical protein
MRNCEVSQSRITWSDMTIGRETLRIPDIPDSTPPIGWKPPGTLALDSRALPAKLMG